MAGDMDMMRRRYDMSSDCPIWKAIDVICNKDTDAFGAHREPR
jgi:hypothetical protein